MPRQHRLHPDLARRRAAKLRLLAAAFCQAGSVTLCDPAYLVLELVEEIAEKVEKH